MTKKNFIIKLSVRICIVIILGIIFSALYMNAVNSREQIIAERLQDNSIFMIK